MNLLNISLKEEEIFRDYFVSLRWPDGKIKCPKCGKHAYTYADTETFGCSARKTCGIRFTATTGTIIASTKMPFSKWICGVYLVAVNKPQISSYELARRLGIRQKASWYMRKDITNQEDEFMQLLLKKMDFEIPEKVRNAIFKSLELFQPQDAPKIPRRKSAIVDEYQELVKFTSRALWHYSFEANPKEVVHECYLDLTRNDKYSFIAMKKEIYNFLRTYRNEKIPRHASLKILSIQPKNRKMIEASKECKQCRENLPIGEFYISTNAFTGQQTTSSYCKSCSSEIRKINKAKYISSENDDE